MSSLYSDIPIPLHLPNVSFNKSFSTVNSMLLSCGPTKVAVITKEGRFDLNNTEFVCSACKASHVAGRSQS